MREVTIIGGGLAGLALGIALRKRGVPVTVYEAGCYPRHRVCGEFITGVDSATLEKLGIADCLDGALQLEDLVWFVDDRKILERTLPRVTWGISRWFLDAELADRFVAAGGILETGKRVALGKPEEAQVRATGRQPAPRNSSRWIGLKAHVEGIHLEADLEMHLGPRGYAGLSRIEGGRVNLCGLFRQAPDIRAKGVDLLAAYLRDNGLRQALERMESGTVFKETFSAVAGMDYGISTPPAAGFVLGDSWTLIPPFTGNGMSMAFESAQLAVDPLVAWAQGKRNWAECTRAYRAALQRCLRGRVLRARLLHALLLYGGTRRLLACMARKDALPFALLYSLTH